MIQSESNTIREVPPPDEHTIWANEEFGIRDNRELARHFPRQPLDKTRQISHLCLRELSYSLNAVTKKIMNKQLKVQFPRFDDESPLGKTGSLGLVLFFHGVNGEASVWDGHIGQLGKAAKLDLAALQVPDAGHCHTDGDGSKTLLNRVVDWTRKNPAMPIALFGQSNGSRFAVKLEIWLRQYAPTTPVHVSLTGGVLFGSSRINQLMELATPENLQKFTSGILSTILCHELAFGCERAKQLVKEAREPLPDNVAERDYVMYASLNDTHVPDSGSSLPVVNPARQARKAEKHYVILDYGHNAIVLGAREKQIQDCLCWMERARPK